MLRITSLVSVICCTAACGGHGYEVSIRAHGLDSRNTAALARLNAVAGDYGLTTLILDAPVTYRPNAGRSSAFAKKISDRPNEFLRMDVVYSEPTDPDRQVWVWVTDDVNGGAPETKREIDAIGDQCRDILVAAAGASNVVVERGPTHPPLFR
jgi:hypothetical protein